MKTKEYVEKYRLETGNSYPQGELLFDLFCEFQAQFELTQSKSGNPNIKGWDQAVRVIRQKWDAINVKSRIQLQESTWKYFYAAFLCKFRDERFPEEFAERARQKQMRKDAYEERKRMEDEMYGNSAEWFTNFFRNAYAGLFSALHDQGSKLHQALDVLELPHTATADDVKARYRQLSLELHPDKGGDQQEFIRMSEAKTKALLYLAA